MMYSFYQLFWLYLIYSFIGWGAEVCIAAVLKKKFINRGFVGGPFCPIYGAGAVSFAIFLPELKDNLFFMFIGGVILASFIEFFTGAVLEKLFHKKWWDYSKERFNFDGYICLKYSLLWGIFAIQLILFVNPFLLYIVELLPHFIGIIIVCVLMGLLAIDAIGTSLAILGLQKKSQGISQINKEMKHISKLLENAITRKIQKRMEKAFPKLAQEAVPKAKATVFAEGCSFYKLISLFFIGAFLGDITETIFCLVATGVFMSRSSVVYGSFSIVWGIGCMLLTAILFRIRNKSDLYIFTVGTVLGGAYEYICSVFTELVFGTIFWDYSGFAFNLGGRINLLYCFFWGIAAVVWMKFIYPWLSGLIEKIPIKPGKIACNILLVFMVFNCIISSFALARYTERNTLDDTAAKSGIAAVIDGFLDERFPDERMEKIYPNAKIVE